MHTVATVKHIGEHGNEIDKIVDASFQRMLVFAGVLIGQDINFYTERYLVQLSEINEANLITALNNIIIGIEKHNRRQAITGWTYASYPTLCHIRLAYGKEVEKSRTNRWYKDIYIDIEWSTS